MDKITKEFLEQNPRACEDQLEIWAAEWPRGMKVTEKNILRCFQLKLDVEWLIHNKLPLAAREEYHKATFPAWKKYNKAVASTWEEYCRAGKEYDEGIALTQEKYNKAKNSAWKKFNRSIAVVREEYDKAIFPIAAKIIFHY